MFAQDYIKDFDALLVQREPFALVRFHDGEHAILSHKPYHAASHWRTRGGDVWFEDELRSALQAEIQGFCIGISPPCCTPAATEYYRRHVKCSPSQQTFATLFQFSNYGRVGALRKRFQDALVIGSGDADITVPTDSVSCEWDLQGVVDKMLSIDRPFLVAAGPCTNVIIYRYWRQQDPARRQTAIDIGAALDTTIHGVPTRTYHRFNTNRHTCEWNKWIPFAMPSTKTNEVQRTDYSKLAEAEVFVGSKRSTKKKRKTPTVRFSRRK